jgi:hypothetical protein
VLRVVVGAASSFPFPLAREILATPGRDTAAAAAAASDFDSEPLGRDAAAAAACDFDFENALSRATPSLTGLASVCWSEDKERCLFRYECGWLPGLLAEKIIPSAESSSPPSAAARSLKSWSIDRVDEESTPFEPPSPPLASLLADKLPMAPLLAERLAPLASALMEELENVNVGCRRSFFLIIKASS